MLRAVIVDDSPTNCALLQAILDRDADIEVVGVANDGVEAVAMVRQLRPDVVTMDIQMPHMNGFEATKEIMMSTPTPIVIVTASTMTRDVQSTMSALRAGALTLVLKPPSPECADFERASQELIATIKAMAHVKVVRHHRPAAAPRRALPTAKAPAGKRAKIVAIAASTGGPQALEMVLSHLPRDFAAPILVVQHISPGFIQGLSAWLGGMVPLRVKIAEANEPLLPGTVYVAPETRHLGVSHQPAAVLSDARPLGGFQPSASFLFDSIARAFGDSALAVVLTGMGQDGLEGLRMVRRVGGTVIAQDEASCVVFGMPGAAVQAGLADLILPLDEIARKLVELVALPG